MYIAVGICIAWLIITCVSCNDGNIGANKCHLRPTSIA